MMDATNIVMKAKTDVLTAAFGIQSLSDAELFLRLEGLWLQGFAESKEAIRELVAQNELLRQENHNLNWAMGTVGYEQMATPEQQAEHEAHTAQIHATLEKMRNRKTRHDMTVPAGVDYLDYIDSLQAERDALKASQSVAYRCAVMGEGKVAIGGCKRSTDSLPGVVYLDMGGEKRDIDADTTDLFPVGTAVDPTKVLAAVYFLTAESVQQSIDVLQELLEAEFGVIRTQPVEIRPRVWFIQGWDQRGMYHGLKGSIDTDIALRERMQHIPEELLNAATAIKKGGA